MPKIALFNTGRRSAIKVTMAAILTKKVRVYSTKVIAALIFTAQLPNSSSLKPLPPLPSVTHLITSRYIAETTIMVIITNQTDAPKVTRATPATTISFKNGPNTYNGEVAGSPPPASAPSKALFNLFEILTAITFFPALLPKDNSDMSFFALTLSYLIFLFGCY